MNQVQIENLNQSIGYKKGEIFLGTDNCYTSNLWEELKLQGWEMDCNEADCVDIFDNEGDWVVSEIGIFNALKSLAITLR